jgi:hypothetical protein
MSAYQLKPVLQQHDRQDEQQPEQPANKRNDPRDGMVVSRPGQQECCIRDNRQVGDEPRRRFDSLPSHTTLTKSYKAIFQAVPA